jgi:hypothetical protein
VIVDNVVTKIPANDPSYSLKFAPASGSISGNFTPDWASPAIVKPSYKGIVLQKGAKRGGYGFFISNIKSDADPKSGSVTLGAKE